VLVLRSKYVFKDVYTQDIHFLAEISPKLYKVDKMNKNFNRNLFL
jgi:hypothetical protein